MNLAAIIQEWLTPPEIHDFEWIFVSAFYVQDACPVKKQWIEILIHFVKVIFQKI